MSGGKKNDQSKTRLDLVAPQFIAGIGRVLTFGAWKYDAHNWMDGIAYSRLIGGALRHVFAWIMGQDCDPETGESHLLHAACCLMFLFWQHECDSRQYQSFDDRVFNVFGTDNQTVEEMLMMELPEKDKTTE